MKYWMLQDRDGHYFRKTLEVSPLWAWAVGLGCGLPSEVSNEKFFKRYSDAVMRGIKSVQVEITEVEK